MQLVENSGNNRFLHKFKGQDTKKFGQFSPSSEITNSLFVDAVRCLQQYERQTSERQTRSGSAKGRCDAEIRVARRNGGASRIELVDERKQRSLLVRHQHRCELIDLLSIQRWRRDAIVVGNQCV